MARFHISGLTDEFTGEVRNTMRSPGYGHPVVREVATGTGPCRACFGLFDVGADERLLFTYRPRSEDGTLGAPGPVVIHARACSHYEGNALPEGLRRLPLFIEARASGNRVLEARTAHGEDADAVLSAMLDDAAVDYLYVRHGEAGCHIARVDRA